MDFLKIRQKEFCRLTNLTRKALLIYEEKKLLEPESIDAKNGYRYYGEDQITRGAMLSFLKNFNFSLNEIESLLKNQITIPELGDKNHTQQELIDKSIKAHHCLSALYLIQHEKTFLETSPLIKTYPQHTVVSLESYGTISDIKMNISRLWRYITKYAINVIGPIFTLYYNDCQAPHFHFKVCFPVNVYYNWYHPDIKWEQLVNYKVAAIRHIGSYETLLLAYKRLNASCKKKKWPCSGVYIESYIIGGDTRFTDSSSFVTEVAAVLA